jgi:hypothetical protein
MPVKTLSRIKPAKPVPERIYAAAAGFAFHEVITPINKPVFLPAFVSEIEADLMKPRH